MEKKVLAEFICMLAMEQGHIYGYDISAPLSLPAVQTLRAQP
jgi:hypothetical protein